LQREIGAGTRFAFTGGVQGAGAGVRTKAVQNAGHIADYAEYNASLVLSLNTGRQDNLVLSFHGLGPRYRGIIGVVAYLSLEGAEPVLIKDGTFQINYEEDVANAQTRFSNWLDRVIVEGLMEWRRTL
jgi:hypothetical protein